MGSRPHLPGSRTAPRWLAIAGLANEVRNRLDEVRQRIFDVSAPFDAIILSSVDDPRRRRYQALAGELIGLSGALRRAGARAGVTVTIGGGG
jgi:hypothetical protein